jgi:hypothetical protein
VQHRQRLDPGVFGDVLLEVGAEFRGKGAPGLADGVPDVVGGDEFLAEPSCDAAPLAKLGWPVPGGPNSTIARGGTRPSRSASCGCASGKITRRSMS